MNRWGFLSVVAVVAGSVAAFAIYTWGWRDDTTATPTAAQVTSPVESDTPAESTEVDAKLKTPMSDSDRAEAALLEIEDLPTGWVAGGAPGPAGEPPIDPIGVCVLPESGVNAGPSASAPPRNFGSHDPVDGRFRQFTTYAWVYTNPEEATNTSALMVGERANCVADRWGNTFRQLGPAIDFHQDEPAPAALSATGLADETHALAAQYWFDADPSAEFDSPTWFVTWVWARSDSLITLIAFERLGAPFPNDEQEALAAMVAERMSRVD